METGNHAQAEATKRLPTKERLLLSAMRLIWRNGYSAVSVDAICADAGANKGSFYHAYASKVAILTRAIERIWEHDRAALLARAEAGGSAASRLERHIDWFLDNQRQLLEERGYVPGHFHMAIDTDAAEATATAMRARAEYHAILRQAVCDMLREADLGEEAADFLTSTIEHMVAGVMIEARLANSLEPVKQLKPLAMQLVALVRKMV